MAAMPVLLQRCSSTCCPSIFYGWWIVVLVGFGMSCTSPGHSFFFLNFVNSFIECVLTYKLPPTGSLYRGSPQVAPEPVCRSCCTHPRRFMQGRWHPTHNGGQPVEHVPGLRGLHRADRRQH